MFLIAPLHCFYLLLFGFLLSTTTVLTTSTAHTYTYSAVRYCSIIELAPLLDEYEYEDKLIQLFYSNSATNLHRLTSHSTTCA